MPSRGCTGRLEAPLARNICLPRKPGLVPGFFVFSGRRWCGRGAGPVQLLWTTTALEVDEELANRALVLTVDESAARTRAIHARQRPARTLEGLLARAGREEMVRLHQHQRSMQTVTRQGTVLRYITRSLDGNPSPRRPSARRARAIVPTPPPAHDACNDVRLTNVVNVSIALEQLTEQAARRSSAQRLE